MKTNNRPIVKETITEHKYMNCETKEICWFDLSTGPKWFETTHYPVNDETRTREYERPMNDTEYIEYLEKEVNERTIVARNLMGNSLSLQRENRELKDQLRDRDFSDKNYQEYLRIETEYQCLLANNNELKGRIALQQSSYEKKFRELNDKLLKVVESVLNDNLKEIEYGQISNSQIIEKIKSAIEKEQNNENK